MAARVAANVTAENFKPIINDPSIDDLEKWVLENVPSGLAVLD